MIQLPQDYMPEWAKYAVTAVLGAGGLHWFRAYLENRRLSKKDFRELLLDRVRELEKVIASMQVRMGNQRVATAHLESENETLKIAMTRLESENETLKKKLDDNQQTQGDDDVQPK